ncbi:hypothetical protein K402DRAFT_306422, partial [Aulographum hederae CBS 113979]
MGRKDFMADLAILEANANTSIDGISNIHSVGDGEFTFELTLATDAGSASYHMTALIPEVANYPKTHVYTIFAADDTPNDVGSKIAELGPMPGRSLNTMLTEVSNATHLDDDGDTVMTGSEPESDIDGDSQFGEISDDGGEKTPTTGLTLPNAKFLSRVRSDLRMAKNSGFKVGHHGAILEGGDCYVSVSCRIAKLGISEEARRAWNLKEDGSDYLVLLIYYRRGYQHLDQLPSDSRSAQKLVDFRVGLSSTYKPSYVETVRAFVTDTGAGVPSSNQSQTFWPCFISVPLQELFKGRFITLTNVRLNYDMSWSGAEMYLDDHQALAYESNFDLGEKYFTPERTGNFPSVVNQDHLTNTYCAMEENTRRSLLGLSLPLLAMQYLLRHFVRCTEFCLVCHCRLGTELEAIKPYVCDKDLCLYQYMHLGFGPSIEHEIISQPQVTDLLISFCYTAAFLGKLSTYPTGLNMYVLPSAAHKGLNIPPSHATAFYVMPLATTDLSAAETDATATSSTGILHHAKYNGAKCELLFESQAQTCPVKPNDWIALQLSETEETPGFGHCRVLDTNLYPVVHLSKPVVSPVEAANSFLPVTFYIYDQKLDDFAARDKQEAVVALLGLLPSVSEMKDYLSKSSQTRLGSWSNRLPNALVQLLRWIIASSRACIMEVAETDKDRVWGMEKWAQFRFAMGAPDKERRFRDAVQETAKRLSLQHPTLFAFHGSPLQNWHSIIREGLHFKDTAHGRAYGHGVYHSLEFQTSLSYTQSYSAHQSQWPQSSLQIGTAMALNELVNAPKEFVSSSPHLVVAKLDWIQTRYLFVRENQHTPQRFNQLSSVAGAPSSISKPSQVRPQDPRMTPHGQDGHIIVPAKANSDKANLKSTNQEQINTDPSRVLSSAGSRSGKSMFQSKGTANDPIPIYEDDSEEDIDTNSVATDAEDRMLFEEDTTADAPVDKGKNKVQEPAVPMTDFVPGALDHSTLPIINSPGYATVSATKRLQQDFKAILKLQNSTPTHELGWYTNPEHLTNVYQWIVELHSFEETLPLAKDMKEKGIKSVVLEIRFGRDHPMSPPFVRVIRPRFLDFHQGGGGHVTAGGALCMELLTNNGWSAVTTIESVLLQVRLAMSSHEPRPARLSKGYQVDYGVREAAEAYIRACRTHGWTVPPGFAEMATGGQSTGGSAYG